MVNWNNPSLTAPFVDLKVYEKINYELHRTLKLNVDRQNWENRKNGPTFFTDKNLRKHRER